jgi:hypothetical protein
MTRIALYASAPVLAAVILLVATLATRRDAPPPPPVQPEITCVMPEASSHAAALQMYQADHSPKPAPDIYAKLEKCLQELKPLWGTDITVTVDEIRYWVEIERDPMWLENGSWWLPLSGEGQPDFPSGIYISVPIHGGACGGAIVN